MKQADTTTTKIALAALCHDLGKFLQEYLEISPEYRRLNEGLYQPSYNNQPTHRHALYTAAFIEQYQDDLPRELNAARWGEGEAEDSFINLAARHHKPYSETTVLQGIITMADRLSSGLDRAEFEQGENVGYRDYRSTRLFSLFEQLNPESEAGPQVASELRWRYPLAPLSTASIFPVPQDKAEVPGAGQSQSEYKNLCEAFVADLKKLANRDNLLLWMQHFDSLLHVYTAQIPAARVGMVIPDVSLYDHARTTSALASALYLFHRDSGTLNKDAVQEASTERFLLVSGDFYGIQDFIFSAGDDAGANRSKLLRGRSFYVSLFSELAADILCREIGLPLTAVMLNAAGKFTLLAPNTNEAQASIKRVRQDLNQHLYDISFGQSSFGLVCTKALQKEFAIEDDRFATLWRRHKEDMEKAKSCKLDLARFGAVNGYLESFNNDLNPPLCPLCGIRPSAITPREGEKATCGLCYDHVLLGAKLVRQENRVLILDEDSPAAALGELRKPVLGRYQLAFKSEEKLAQIQVLPEGVLRVWQTGIYADGSVVSAYTNRFLNGYVPAYEKADLEDARLIKNRKENEQVQLEEGVVKGWPKTFQDIARSALHCGDKDQLTGVPALGILKADVDQLGALMACGLPKKQATISRMAALSRQLDSFFSVYLPHLLRDDPELCNVYTVFAGGDDLFLIGPWNKMTRLTLRLRDEFAHFVCKNSKIHFSAGLMVTQAQIPVNRLAQQAEEALEQAKNAGRNRVTVFGETMEWDELQTVFAHTDTLENWRGRLLSRALFYRLNGVVSMAAAEKRLFAAGPVHFHDMQCLRWRAMLQYQLTRNLTVKDTGREAALKELEQLPLWLHRHGGAMKIPLWHVLYNNRTLEYR